MKLVAAYTVSIFVFLFTEAQEAQAQATNCEPERIAIDVRNAATQAGITATEDIVKAFEDSTSIQDEVYGSVCRTVSEQVRVQRLAEYLRAKAAVGNYPDFRDFHWNYLRNDFYFVPMQFEGQPASLASIELATGLYDFQYLPPLELKPGSVFLVPRPLSDRNGALTATFDVGPSQAVWTGTSSSPRMEIRAAITTMGSEIFVNSEPVGAAVYFNNRLWYRKTNTSAVQDPGVWEVRVHLPGYKEWRKGERSGPGNRGR